MPTPHRRFKDDIYGQFARIGKALAAPKRLELLDLLCQGPRTVEALAEQGAISVANASQHLQILRAARLVEAEKKGLYVEYRLADGQVCGFLYALRELAEARLAEVEQVTRAYLSERGAMEAVKGDELLRRVREGAVTVLDVRPAEEYRGHIPGALSVPSAPLPGSSCAAGFVGSASARAARHLRRIRDGSGHPDDGVVCAWCAYWSRTALASSSASRTPSARSLMWWSPSWISESPAIAKDDATP